MSTYEKGSTLPLGNIVLAAVAAIVLVSVAWYVGGPRGTETDKKMAASPKKIGSNERVHIEVGNSPSLGKPDAKVVIVAFADYQCPFCAVLHFGAESAMIKEYVAKGKVKFTFKQYPFLGEESVRAAMASKCAEEQGRFWEYHGALFERQTQSAGENIGVFSAENLTRIAGEVNLNENMFTECLASGKHTQTVSDEWEEGKRAGVENTPTMFINGKKTEGALSFEVYKEMIEEELSR